VHKSPDTPRQIAAVRDHKYALSGSGRRSGSTSTSSPQHTPALLYSSRTLPDLVRRL